MKIVHVLLVIGLLTIGWLSCKKDPALQRPSISEVSVQASAASVPTGASHESFDRLPLDLNWIVEYKPNANAFKIVQDHPEIGRGAGKFILYPDALINGKNRTQMDYYPNHPVGSEATYSFYVRIPNSRSTGSPITTSCSPPGTLLPIRQKAKHGRTCRSPNLWPRYAIMRKVVKAIFNCGRA